MRRTHLFLLIQLSILSITIMASCSASRKAENIQNLTKASMPGPKVIIYQTSKDYSQLVPVILSDDKMTIDSYPDVKDIYFNGNLALPTSLHNGYLLDNRGISKNVAFLKLTYMEYSKLAKTPTAAQLMEMIIDRAPLISMYNCGNRSDFKDIVKDLNAKIEAGDFSSFLKIK